ncbi:hypothetical protein [Lactococcus lactis]|uniref:hypothetical protein n=1 Tax=Lactococcus lactis TaxID=1358 RepID=UPI000BF2B5CA|nr:hypothetical protein [Lactococcus lactis]PFG78695.1 hypothetical protein BW151_10180 [Lactococcus lactis]
MKLFIWQGDGVLQDWTSGQIVALAPDLEQALKAIENECDYCMDSFPNHNPTEIIDLGQCSEKVQNKAWVTWGGG